MHLCVSEKKIFVGFGHVPEDKVCLFRDMFFKMQLHPLSRLAIASGSAAQDPRSHTAGFQQAPAVHRRRQEVVAGSIRLPHAKPLRNTQPKRSSTNGSIGRALDGYMNIKDRYAHRRHIMIYSCGCITS